MNSNERVLIEYVPLEQVKRWPRNPKRHNLSELNQSLDRFGFVSPIVRDDSTGRLVAGHGRLEALMARRDAGLPPPKRVQDLGDDWAVPVLSGVAFETEEEAEAYLVADNRLVEMGGWDDAELTAMMQRVTAAAATVEEGLRGTGVSKEELDALLMPASAMPDVAGSSYDKPPAIAMGTLAARFGVPPFSVLDARQGYWRERKNWWLSLGIQSEIGRGGKFRRGDLHATLQVKEPSGAKVGLFADGSVSGAQSAVAPGGSLEPLARAKLARAWAKSKNSLAERMERAKPGEEGLAVARAAPPGETVNRTGTSIFDPVLCELSYRWFCPTGGKVLDPFAGGSVRGVVAAVLGLHYTGIDLRKEQTDANAQQWRDIEARLQDADTADEPKKFGTAQWVVGDSSEVLASPPAEAEMADMVFTCPPYFDLEVYSDDPKDISTMDPAAFAEVYKKIIAGAVARLRNNRFAAAIVGEVRDKKGFYLGLVPLTIAAFEAAGATFYNEAILVTAIGSLPVRAGRAFASGRKLGKTHQNVLVFFKGDPAQIPKEFPSNIDITLPEVGDDD